jgi:hypothetical protein
VQSYGNSVACEPRPSSIPVPKWVNPHESMMIVRNVFKKWNDIGLKLGFEIEAGLL